MEKDILDQAISTMACEVKASSAGFHGYLLTAQEVDIIRESLKEKAEKITDAVIVAGDHGFKKDVYGVPTIFKVWPTPDRDVKVTISLVEKGK